MRVTIEIPDELQKSLQDQLGENLASAAKETLAIAWYQAEKLSIGQVAELLGISVYDAEGLMKQHHVEAPYSLDDYENDRQSLDHLLNR